MSAPKHTAGPWAVFNATDVFTDYEGESDGWQIADCDAHMDEFSNYAPLATETRKANARPIAAAPCMDGALAEVIELLSYDANDLPAHEYAAIKADVLARAKAARVKAIGADQ